MNSGCAFAAEHQEKKSKKSIDGVRDVARIQPSRISESPLRSRGEAFVPLVTAICLLGGSRTLRKSELIKCPPFVASGQAMERHFFLAGGHLWGLMASSDVCLSLLSDERG